MREHFIYNRHKTFLNIVETVANDRPINIYIYTNTFTLKAFYTPLKEWYAYDRVYTYTPQLSL